MTDAIQRSEDNISTPVAKKGVWPIFISYRRSDVTRSVALWLKEQLECKTVQSTTGQSFSLDVFVDVAEPHQSDFQANLLPHLEHSRALIVVADEGVTNRKAGTDYLYAELDWWAGERRKTPPIVLQLDSTSAAKLVADPKYESWRKVNFLDCFWEKWASDSNSGTIEKDRLIRALCDSIRNYGQIIHLDEVRRLKRWASIASLFGLAALVAAGFAWWLKGEADAQSLIAQKRQEAAEASKKIALAQLRSANSSIETLTGFAESAGGRTRTERELLIESANAYNRILAGESSDDPAFQFERAWALNRLSQVAQRLEKFGFRPTGKGATEGVIDSSKEAEDRARLLLDNLILRDPASSRYVNERGQNSMLKAMRLLQNADYIGAVSAIAAAIVDFDSALAIEPDFTLFRLHRAEASDRYVTVLYAIPGREADASKAVEQAERDFQKLIEVSSAQLGVDSISTLDYRMLSASFKATEGDRRIKSSPAQATSHLISAFSEAYSVGLSYRDHGRYERSDRAISMAESIGKTLFDMNPEDAANADRYGKALNARGDLLLSTARDDDSQIKEAKRSFEAALQIYGRLCGDGTSPVEPDYKHLYAGVLHNLAEIIVREGRPAEAITQYDVAIAIHEALVSHHPSEMEYREFLRNHRIMKTRVLMKLGRKSEAQEELGRLVADANSDFDIVRTGGPNVANSRPALAKTFAGISEMAFWFDLRDTAINACKSAMSLLEAVVNESQDETDRFNLAVGYGRLATMQRTVGAETEAKLNYKRCIDALKQLVKENPSQNDYTKELQDAERRLNDPHQ